MLSRDLSNPSPPNVKSVVDTAAREHVAQDRPIRAHVIVTHDFRKRSESIMAVFKLAWRLDENTLDQVHRQLVQDLLGDLRIYRLELDDIERWARAQLTKRPTSVRS